jgi:hypothetical protein
LGELSEKFLAADMLEGGVVDDEIRCEPIAKVSTSANFWTG